MGWGEDKHLASPALPPFTRLGAPLPAGGERAHCSRPHWGCTWGLWEGSCPQEGAPLSPPEERRKWGGSRRGPQCAIHSHACATFPATYPASVPELRTPFLLLGSPARRYLRKGAHTEGKAEHHSHRLDRALLSQHPLHTEPSPPSLAKVSDFLPPLCGVSQPLTPQRGKGEKNKQTPVPCWLRKRVRSVTLLRCFTLRLKNSQNWHLTLQHVCLCFGIKRIVSCPHAV